MLADVNGQVRCRCAAELWSVADSGVVGGGRGHGEETAAGPAPAADRAVVTGL